LNYILLLIGILHTRLTLLTALILILCVSISGIVLAQQNYSLAKMWGSKGSGEGQIDQSHGVGIDSSGNVYVVDTGNFRVQKFDSNGKFITMWGSEGEGEGQFLHGHDIAIDSSGNIYVTDVLKDTDVARVQKFDSNGKFITMWGSKGSEKGQFDYMHGIDVDSSGNVYVSDTANNRVQKFDSNGNFITMWGSEGEGQFIHPHGIDVDSSGNVYVADQDKDSNIIQKFMSEGT
jgi:tripartite motif-containing protein 71